MPRAGRTLLVCLFVSLLASCGDSGEGPRPEDDEGAASEREVAEEKRRGEARRALARAEGLAAEDRIPEACAALESAIVALGETTEAIRIRDAIRKRQRELDLDRETGETLAALSRDGSARTEEERLDILAEAERRARTYLEKYPDSASREEIEAGWEYARAELDRRRKYMEALREAREHLRGERYGECVKACGRALEILDRPEPREIRNLALEKLTPEGMVFVPGGVFPFGPDRERSFLPAFYVDRTEVTNARYHAFVTATAHPPPHRFVRGAPIPGEEQKPVTYVTLEDALAYARWAKKRLPTELEWERAARGTDGRIFPWGNQWDPAKGHFGSGGTLPVGSKPLDRSPDGVMDMAGNVMEITLPLSDPKGERSGPVMKGGRWSDDFHPEYATTFARCPVDRDHAGSGSGFRCVRSAP